MNGHLMMTCNASLVRHLRDVVRDATTSDYIIKGFAKPGRRES